MELRFRDDPIPVTPPPASLFHIPHRPNPHFVGRHALLESLADELSSPDPRKHIQALYGLGGVGKTQTAIQYAHLCRQQYKIIWWLRAEESASIWIDYAQLARALGLPLPADDSLDAIRHQLRRHLETRDDYLLIFDNASSAAALAPFIPSPCRGAVLITSRNANWTGLARGVAVHGLAREESVDFLRKRTGQSDPASARNLAKTLGDLPLALEQAAALIHQSRISVAEYLRRFETQWAQMLTHQRPGGDYPDSLALSWELSFRQAEEESPAAGALLNLLAFLATDGVPQQMINSQLSQLPDPLRRLAGDPTGLDRAIAVLTQYSLIEQSAAADSSETTLSLHPLVAAMARDRMGEEERQLGSAAAARLLGASFKFDSASPATWAQTASLLPHALAAATHAQAAGAPVELTCNLLDQAGRYLNRFAQYDQAKALLDRTLTLSRRAYGDDSPKVSQVANNLGRDLARLGERDLARQHFEWALTIDRNRYGDADPHVATVMNNYAMVLHASGQLDDARLHFESALSIFENHYGAEHPKVATLLNNLGCLHLASGDARSAHDLFHRAISIAEQALSPAHPSVASMAHNLGDALLKLGHPLLARDQFERALASNTATFSGAHPEIARNLEALADTECALDHTDAAESFQSRATALRASLARRTDDPTQPEAAMETALL